MSFGASATDGHGRSDTAGRTNYIITQHKKKQKNMVKIVNYTEKVTLPHPCVYCGTYGKYAAGSIAGAWVDIIAAGTPERVLEKCNKIHKDEANPEFMFQDFNGFPQQFYKESMNAKDFDNVLQWYAEEVKELSKPTKKIENKGFKDMKPEFLETIESKSWRAFRKKEFFAVLKLPEGWLPIDKSTIETTFWVSEGSDRPMKEALKICDYYRTKEGFIESNLPDAEKLEKQKKLKAFIYLENESEKLYSVRFDVDKEEADRHVYGGTLRELTPEEKAAYIAAHDAETENCKKRLETWWKRYGADHIHAHTYWTDR